MNRHAIACPLLAIVTLLSAGCAATPKSPLPTFPSMPVAQSLEVMRERSAKLERVTGRGALTLENADRGAVTLDAIFVLAPPDRARVRAYKFTQAVFDLTLNPDGLFIFVPRERGKPGELLDSTRGAAGAIRQWLASFAGQVDASDAAVTQDARSITVVRREADGMTRTTIVDRATLTVRSQTVRDAAGAVRFTLKLDGYSDFAGTLWPARIVAVSERGTITLETRELQPNVAADTAFTPPPRAVEGAMIGPLATLPTRRPRLVLIVALLATLVSIALAFRLRPETSIEGLLDPTDPAVSAMGKVLTRFPLVEEMLVLATLPAEAPAEVDRLVAFADRLTQGASALRGTDGEPLVAAIRYRPEPEMFDFVQREVVPNGLAYLDDEAYAQAMDRLTRAGMEEQFARGCAMLAVPGPAAAGLGKALIRDPLRLHEFLLSQIGRLSPGGMRFAPGDAGPPGRAPFLSPDGRSLLIRISGTQPPSRLDFCKEIADAVGRAVREANVDGLEVRIGGAYAVAAHNAAAIRHDAILGVNGSVVGILILFALLYRRPFRLFTFAFVPMAMGIAWGFGLFAALRPTVTPLAAVIGGALAGIGIDYFVFFVTHAGRRAGAAGRVGEIDQTLGVLRSALFTAWATSCIGFVAVAWSPVRVLRDFALLGTLALGGAYVASVTVLPAALALFDRRRGLGSERPIAAPIGFTRPLGRWVFRHGAVSIGLACASVAACLLYIAVAEKSLAPRSSLLSLHPQPNPPIEAQREIAARMEMSPGSVQIYFTAPTPDALLSLAHEIDRRVRGPQVAAAGGTGAFGLASVLPDPARVAARAANADPALLARVASDLAAAATAAGFNAASFSGYATFLERLVTPGQAPTIADLAKYPAVAQTVLPRSAAGADAARTEGLMMVFFNNPLDAREQRDTALDALSDALSGLDGVTVTGMAPIGRRLEASIRRDLGPLVTIAVVLIAIVHAVHFRSVGLALLSIVPTAASGVAVLAFMHATDRPLDVVNMVMVPLLIGIDTDYGILTITAWQRARSRTALVRSFPAAASAIVTCAGTTLVGFGSLALVSIPAIATLGWLITVGILACLAATIFLVWPVMFLLSDRAEGRKASE